MIMIKKIKNKEQGITILETIFYIALFTILSVTVISAMLTMTRAFKETRIQREIMGSGEIMEKIGREIKQADDINSLDTPADLRLDSKDENGAYKLVEFSLVNSNIRFSEKGVFTGNLNSPDIKVDNLIFTQILTTKGKAIKIVLTVNSLDDPQARTYDFYDTVVIRGKY